MLLTFDELGVPSPDLRQTQSWAWDGAFLVGSQALLVVQFLCKKDHGRADFRTMLTTAKRLTKCMPPVLPAIAFRLQAVRCQHNDTSPAWAIDQVWLPAQTEAREGVLLRVVGEQGLRDGALEQVPDVEGRALFFEVRMTPWLGGSPGAIT